MAANAVLVQQSLYFQLVAVGSALFSAAKIIHRNTHKPDLL